MDKVFYILLLLIIGTSLLDKCKKEKRKLYFSNFILLLVAALFFYMLSIPNFRSNQMPEKGNKNCFNRQADLDEAIRKYNFNQKKIFPRDCNNEDFIKYQKDYLIENGYLTKVIKPHGDCSYEIKDGNFYCLNHGSFNPESSFYTDGFPVNDNGEMKKQFLEKVEQVQKKRSEQRKRESDSLKLSILLLVGAIKYLFFTIRCFL